MIDRYHSKEKKKIWLWEKWVCGVSGEEKFFSSLDSELRFLVSSLQRFINEFMEVGGERSAWVTVNRTFGTKHGDLGSRAGGMEEWNAQGKEKGMRKGRQRWVLVFEALPASFQLWDELANLAYPINSNDRDSPTLTFPFVPMTSNTAWLHHHILSGLTVHYWCIPIGTSLTSTR